MSLSTRAATLFAVAGLAFGAGALHAQKALVYCPVAIDATGCTTIVSALAAESGVFPAGIDRGYDGSDGTVDLATADLSAYTLVVVPSLADGDSVAPYTMLRDPAVAARLRDALTGRIAVWSGTPDRGSTNRAAKDVLLRNLARWAVADAATGRGPGLVALQDNSDDPTARYAWLNGLSGLAVAADTTLEVYANVQTLTATGIEVLTANGLQIGYTNMASYGLLLPGSGGGIGSADATGGRTSRVVLVTAGGVGAGDSSIATVRTDREDYAPGDTVTVTGTGWAPGETVLMSLHEDPLVHGDRTLTAVADTAGRIYNNQFAPEEHDLGVRFVLTAIGQTSGRTAQTTFTDARTILGATLNVGAGEVASVTVPSGAPITAKVTVTTTQDGGTSTRNWNSTAWSIAAPSPGTLACVNHADHTTVGTFTESFPIAAPADPGTYNAYFVAYRNDPCNQDPSNQFTLLGGVKVEKANTTTAITADTPDPSVTGQNVTVQYTVAVVAPGAGTPTGNVTVTDGVSSCTGTAAAGSCVLALATTGARTLTATYVGDTRFNGSASAGVAHQVNVANIAPVAANDAYQVDEDNALTVPAPGVLGNDNDPNGDAIAAVLVGNVSHGTLTLNANGAFTYTPAANYNGTDAFTYRTSDGTLSSAIATVTITVNPVNDVPVAANDAYSVSEDNTLTVPVPGVLGNDNDADANPITAVLGTTTSHGTLTLSANGSFIYVPAADFNGTDSFTYTANDGTTSSAVVKVTITVTPVADDPVLTLIGDKTIAEDSPLTFTAAATSPDGLPLTFSLVGAPVGASINASTGAFAWTPTEAQGPGSYTFKVRVRDNSPSGVDDEQITVTVTEVNQAPVLAAIGNKTVDELTALTFTAAAADADLPANALTYSLVGAPAGATINPSTGVFSWTPTEAQGPGTYTFTVKVTDNGAPALSDEETITVTVNEVNAVPVLDAIGDRSVDEGTLLAFTATAADADGNPLTYSLGAGAPAGAAITPAGAFTWTPTEAQGPGTHSVIVRVSDGLGGEDAETITITVNEVNQAPVLADVPASATIPELAPYTFNATATDADQPVQTLTYSLVGAPAGAAINSSTGAFNWTPSEAQGPGTYPFSVRVSDGVTYSDAPITLTVSEVNVPPTLTGVPASATIDEEAAYTFDADATDSDEPPQALAFSLVGAPAGANINPATGAFSWTPTETQGPGTYTFSVRVSDGVDYAEVPITLTVKEVNRAPTLAAIDNKTVDEGTALTFAAAATDPDLPANTLTYALGPGAPAGATIDPGTGAFSWTPTEAQGPGSYPVTVLVSDGLASDAKSFTVTVNEVNAPPVVQPVADQSVDEGATVAFTAAATDPDVPANTLTYSLAGAPVGATIDPATGAFSWATGEADGPGVYTFKVVATDNGTPALSGETTVKVTVKEVNVAPVLAVIGNKTVDELTALTFTASATDVDLPANTLGYSLVGAPAGATINPSTGVFSWTPIEAQGPGSYTFAVRVTDNGTPTLSDEETITVTVKEVNEKPTLAAIASQAVNEGTSVSFTATATDPDVPANVLSYSLVGAPAGATINPATGAFNWTPTDDAPTGTPSDVYTFKVRVTDNGVPVLSDERTVTITVNNVAPTIAAITAPVAPVNVTMPVTVSTTFNDVGSGDTHTALIAWGDGQTTVATVSETNGSGTATHSHTYADAGVYTVVVTLTDDDGGSVTQTYNGYVVVYDPSAGFVTGGGWIMSPAGAYLPVPSLTGKATFGFVSKYQKGANVPTGNTEFQFHASDFNFSSTSYEWLVVSGSSKASYKGEGTVNGRGRYGFMLSVVDDASDKFRIKIWDKNAGDAVVYDNQMGAAVDADATTAIAGGSIVVHATKSTASK